MAKLLLQTDKVSLAYPDTTTGLGLFRQEKMGHTMALKNVSIELREGENLALVGENGSGKSTLLRILAGVYPPSAGIIETFGNSIQGLFNMGIGMKTELTGRQNAIIMSMIGGKTSAEAESSVAGIFEFAELKGVVDQPVRTYSRGMAMRLSFAVATSLQPEILLIDEWIGAGDEKFKLKAEKRLNNMIGSSKGFILASHNSHIVKQYCKKAVWLEKGVLKMSGPSEDIIDQYVEHSKRQRQEMRDSVKNSLGSNEIV